MAYFHFLLHKFCFFLLLPTVSAVFEIIAFAQFAPHVAIWCSLIFYMMYRNQQCTCSRDAHLIFLGQIFFFTRSLKNDTLFAKMELIYLTKYTFF